MCCASTISKKTDFFLSLSSACSTLAVAEDVLRLNNFQEN